MGEAVTWARKVAPSKIRQLYELDAKGLLDEAFVDDVGVALLARCDSMLLVTAMNLGRPLCVHCRTPMPHSWEKTFVMDCPGCGWSIAAGDYTASYKGQTLNGVGALPALETYVRDYPLARGLAAKMRAIDALIHSFHGELGEEPSRPTAVNLIDANVGEVARLIFTLAYGEGSEAYHSALSDWLEKFDRSISRNIDPATGTLREGVAYLYEGVGKKGKGL